MQSSLSRSKRSSLLLRSIWYSACRPVKLNDRPADLARRAQMTPQSMNELTAPLFRKGFMKRRPHPEDSRVLLLSLTSDGQRLLARCDKLMDEVEQEMFGCLDRQNLTSLRASLSKILFETRRAEDEPVSQQSLAG